MAVAPRVLPAQKWWTSVGHWLEASSFGAFVSSAVVHAAMMMGLSLLIIATPAAKELLIETSIDSAPIGDLEEGGIGEVPIETDDFENPSLGDFQIGDEIALPGPMEETIGSPLGESLTPQIGGTLGSEAASVASLARSDSLLNEGIGGVSGEDGAGYVDLAGLMASRGGGLEGRTLENRRAAALAGGGTPRSEAAVEAALRWFAAHQWSDGGWSFDLKASPHCNGSCGDSGSHQSRTGATGLALLCFLGAGYTHESGEYQEVVERGLNFLQKKMVVTSHGGDLRDHGQGIGGANDPLAAVANMARGSSDTMYSQGIASLALTEAYAMTHDRKLHDPVEDAIKFILDAQYGDGGWRYTPRWEGEMGGDTTVSGWQIAALKSASLTDIEIPSETWRKIGMYLDSVEYDDSVHYLYVKGDSPTRRTAATPIGLLCRMINGWPRNFRPLQQGAAQLGQVDPSQKDTYFNYYTSQVLHHVGGRNWKRWNPKMREYLIATQARNGHEEGSWYFSEPHSSTGGRLYTTAMATMTLEVYYRYMPLYKETFVENSRVPESKKQPRKSDELPAPE